mgnify:CR=1 FL=1
MCQFVRFFNCAVHNYYKNYMSERKLIMESDGFARSLLILAVVLYKGFCTVCETAVTEIDDRKVRNDRDKSKKHRRLAELLDKPSKLMTAFAVNRVMTAVMTAYLALFAYGAPLKKAFVPLFGGNSESLWAEFSAAVIICAAASC